MKKIFLALTIFALLSGGLFAHEYVMKTNATYSGLTGGTQIQDILTGGTKDDGYYDMTLPAANQFYFYGQKVTHIRIWTNGYVTFGFGSAPSDYDDDTNDPIPHNDNPNSYVAPWWDDWDFTTGGSISYYIHSGNYIMIYWVGVPHHSDTTASYDFKVLLYAHTNATYPDCIRFSYYDTDSGTGVYDLGASGTIGIEHYTGQQAEVLSYNEQSLSNSQGILFSPYVPIYSTTIDTYDTADGYPDAIVWRPSNGYWYYYNSSGSTNAWKWGTRGDVPLPGDYDGDGDSDEMVYRPNNGFWYCGAPSVTFQFGLEGDIPCPGDFNGDGQDDLAVFRPSNGYWYVYYLDSGFIGQVKWGTAGDIPVPADYDNDGKADATVYRPSNGYWYVRKSSDLGMLSAQWGMDGDIPMPANYNTSSYSTFTVYRPSNGYWYSYDVNTTNTHSRQWGLPYDVPCPGDENNGGLTDNAVFRPYNGYWYVWNAIVLPSSFQWGVWGDKPRYRRSFLVVTPPPSNSGQGDHIN